MTDNLSRIQADLSIIQEAIGGGLPFDRTEARAIGLGSLLALPAALWGLLGSARSPFPELVIVVTLLAIYVASSALGKRAHNDRHEQPIRWREHKLSLFLVLLLSIAALAYLGVSLWNDLSWNVAMATAIFFAGISAVAIAVVDRSRLYLLGGAIPTLIYGVFFPLYDSRQLLLATAAWIAASCLATSALMFRQLNDRDALDAAD